MSFTYPELAKCEVSVIHRLSDRDLYVMAPNNTLVTLELSKDVVLRIAEIYLVNLYGNKVLNQKPWIVEYHDDNYIVKGQLPKDTWGGVAEIEIRRSDGKVVRYSHGR